MNASCALQHFCDLHGPQILLCTEARTHVQDPNDNDDEVLKTVYSQYIKSENLQGKVECKSCTLSSDHVLVSSIDSVNHMLYISSPSTPNQELFKNTRNACKSVEVDAPVMFGDDESGYCLSLAFSCKDFHARGSQRLYSLCYLCNDKYHLLSLMKVLTECLRHAVYWLQYDANQTYEQEGRIKLNTKLNGSSTTITTYVFRPPPTVPLQRMLSDIVHDSKVTYRIHALFVWLLRIANTAIRETLFDALPTEEQTTKLERKDVLDDEEVTSSLVKRRRTTIVSKSVINGTENSVLLSSTLTNNSECLSYLAASLYSNFDAYHQNENFLEEEDDFDSLQYNYSSNSHEAFKLYELFIKKLNNAKYLQHILHNWVIGNRLIIKYTNRTDNKDLVRALASVFRLLLPDGCFNLIEVTNKIVPCTANLVLFDTDLVLTKEVLSSITEDFNDSNSIVVKIILDDIDDNLRVVKLESVPPSRSENHAPRYVKTILGLTTDNILDEEAFESIIIHNKIKYLNKAKVYFQFGRCQTATTVSSNDCRLMSIFNVENASDLAMIRFWQKGLSQAYKAEIRILKQDDNQRKKKDRS
ncbi:unnamed protein product [Rotaria socialis]|uniref:Folliculin n=1 Tax=Rotaria socialis TaxID=392032 RepID=A0A818RER0_9BILA|nr:unnamed protein product [Rotaria socialis]CAF3473020.1 unnamed protein product [Rotaria socialis]CAF3566278.1 unnamed protein product [Rotaria socialis]CAF3583790.1 unnamed protein product [Rotaria socialis]CAF3649406.1 unnamed protein product [Rotaria socialis]